MTERAVRHPGIDLGARCSMRASGAVRRGGAGAAQLGKHAPNHLVVLVRGVFCGQHSPDVELDLAQVLRAVGELEQDAEVEVAVSHRGRATVPARAAECIGEFEYINKESV